MRFTVERQKIDGFEVIELTDTESGATARVAPQLGFNIFSLRLDVAGKLTPILLEPPSLGELKANPSRYGNPVLFPFPNRIRDGKYSWKGKAYATPANASGHAIHGYALRSAWRVITEQGGDDHARVEARWQLSVDAPEHREHWPADAVLTVSCKLGVGGLTIEAVVSNPDTVDLPWGLGYHTYFRMPLTESTDTAKSKIVIPAARRWELEGFLPTGRQTPLPAELDFRQGLPLAGLKADDVLTGLEHGSDGSSECHLIDETIGREVFLAASPEFTELVVFTPSWNPNAIALEPYTQTTDAINLAARGIEGGLKVLPPGSSARALIRIGKRPVR